MLEINKSSLLLANNDKENTFDVDLLELRLYHKASLPLRLQPRLQIVLGPISQVPEFPNKVSDSYPTHTVVQKVSKSIR